MSGQPDITRDEALACVRNRLTDPGDGKEEWWHAEDCRIYEQLLLQLVDDHGMTHEAALGILASAYGAAANEYGD